MAAVVVVFETCLVQVAQPVPMVVVEMAFVQPVVAAAGLT